MPKSIVSGNGNLLVAMDRHNLLADLYYPYVGMEAQIAYQHFHRIGVRTDDKFSWLYEPAWQFDIKYIPETLVTDTEAYNPNLQLRIRFNDFVYPSEDVFVRKITFMNEANHDRNLQMFFSQDFHLYGDKQQDTAFYEPEHKAMVHYRKRRYFWISGATMQEKGIHSFTTGKSEYRGMEGTWRDAEDGHLQENPIEQGSVDSTVEFDVKLKKNAETVMYFWICAGRNIQDVTVMHKFILDESPEKLMKNTVNYWLSWVNKEFAKTQSIGPDIHKQYKQSLLIMRTQIDNRGAVIAANDSDIMKFNKDTYCYMWPRDGAWVSIAMNEAGYGEITERFFRFCADAIMKEGYLLHKYNPDKSVGSSWHPWYKDGEIQIPIQEDETALVLHALWRHFQLFRDIEFLQEMYNPLIRRAGNFMMGFINHKLELPLPTYDLWERERGVFSYTCACVYAGLVAASNLSGVLGHFNHRRRYQKAAEQVKRGILKHLYDEEKGRFLKRVEVNLRTGEIKKDYGLDASMHGLWMMGVLPPDDPMIVKTNEAIYNTLLVRTPVGGLARSENDDYMRVPGFYDGIPGNPWIITTLWHAQWKLALTKTKDDLKEVEDYLMWAIGHMNKAGILPEQLDPFTGEHLSVAPLTWSHAVFVDTVLKYNDKLKEFIS
ncbi:glycoside hydrolase family 15 protein [Candidatus Peregrinibacteria bacterium]|nr:glycoside hydrolase family 15 protein [Candidatus Peregrinibacteria bacterium]